MVVMMWMCGFSGELEVARAKNVILYTTLSNKGQDRDNGLCGLLVVTNFKLSFLSSDNEQVRMALHLYGYQYLDYNRSFLSSFFQNITYQENFFLQCNDVTLQNIDRIYQIVDRKKRAVNPYSKINPKLDGLHIVCKVRIIFIENGFCHTKTNRNLSKFISFLLQNFRVLRFGFKRCELGQGKRIAEALTKFAFPNQHDLIFAYKYK